MFSITDMRHHCCMFHTYSLLIIVHTWIGYHLLLILYVSHADTAFDTELSYFLLCFCCLIFVPDIA